MKDVLYLDEAAVEYDRAFAHVSEHFLPFLLGAAHLSPGMRVLDVATGTGLAAQAALDLIGPNGSVAATDVSPAMVEQARKRFAEAGNVSVSVEDGQSLSFPDRSFDAIIHGSYFDRRNKLCCGLSAKFASLLITSP